MNNNIIKEAIVTEADLLTKLRPLTESDIFTFMDALKGGTYFNMGMYSTIPVSKAYKSSLRIYKVIDLAAIVSGVSYENIETTKDFRNQTNTTAGSTWYSHKPGYENKIGVKKSNPANKYVLWDIKQGTNTVVRYYIVDIATGAVTPVSKADIMASSYLTQAEKNKLIPQPVVGFNKQTGDLVINKTIWRTAAFEHIFWLNQGTREFGSKFTEALHLKEDTASNELYIDGNADCEIGTLDKIISSSFEEDCKNCDRVSAEALKEETIDTVDSEVFQDGNADCEIGTVDAVLSGKKLHERDSRYTPLVDNDFFVDFD